MNSAPYFYPSRPIRGDGDDGDDGGGLRVRDVIVGGYCGEVADVKGGPAADFVRGRDRSEGAHFVAWGDRLEIRSQN